MNRRANGAQRKNGCLTRRWVLHAGEGLLKADKLSCRRTSDERDGSDPRVRDIWRPVSSGALIRGPLDIYDTDGRQSNYLRPVALASIDAWFANRCDRPTVTTGQPLRQARPATNSGAPRVEPYGGLFRRVPLLARRRRIFGSLCDLWVPRSTKRVTQGLSLASRQTCRSVADLVQS